MKIMIINVAAESGGALSILQQFYEDASKDLSNEWIFIISTPHISPRSNINVLQYPWIKKSWFHRLFFDYFVAPSIVKRTKVDKVISLQNIRIPRIKEKQTIYMHQALPFVKYKFRFNQDPKLWIYQNLIGKMIIKSLKSANEIIVQTNWIADAVVNKTGVDFDKITIKKPRFDIKVEKTYQNNNSSIRTFFYPAGPYKYKNHEVIVNAVRKIDHELHKNIDIIFTLSGNENKNIIKLYNIIKEENLPIRFVGSLNILKVYDYYTNSILVFPSYIETFGLPLLEAKMHKTPIIASDCEFSHEILKDYPLVKFFPPFDALTLSEILAEGVK